MRSQKKESKELNPALVNADIVDMEFVKKRIKRREVSYQKTKCADCGIEIHPDDAWKISYTKRNDGIEIFLCKECTEKRKKEWKNRKEISEKRRAQK